MTERNEYNSTLAIKRYIRRVNQLLRVTVLSDIPITEKCVRRFMLMQEDCIVLEFSLSSDELRSIADIGAISIGDFVDDEIFGRFYVTEAQMPKYNAATDGYDYSLRLDAGYMLWKNWMHCLTVEIGGELQRVESAWSLTDRLQTHAQQIADEVNLLIEGGNYTVQIDAENANEIHFISYGGKNIIESLNLIADTWKCEWWVDQYEQIIHFGKMENETSYEFRLGGNVESMDIARDQQTYATRLFVYGGTQNIPEDYDRKLEFTVSSITGDGFLDENRTLKLDMIDGEEIDATNRYFHFSDYSPDPNPATPANNVATYTIESSRNELQYRNTLQGTIESWFEMESDDWAAWDVPEVTASVEMKYGAREGEAYFPNTVPVATTTLKRGAGRWRATIDLNDDFSFGNTASGVKFVIVWTVRFVESSVHKGDTIAINNQGSIKAFNPNDLKKLVTVIYNGNEYLAKFFNVTKRIQFIDNANSQNVVSAPQGWDEGEVYGLEPLTLKVPLSWYTPIYETGTMSKVGEKRLHLPLDDYPNRYLPADPPFEMSQCVEEAVIIDDVFPKLNLRIKPGSITTTTKKQKIEHSDGSVSWEDWVQYSFQLQYCTDEEHSDDDNYWSPFVFKEEYMLDGEKLQAAFTAPAVMPNSGFMLSGMTFDVSFDGVNSTIFTIIRNENYGAKLPNEYLMPSDRDTLFLTGWNPKAMRSMGLVDLAERELARQGNAYKQAIKEGQFTFTCRMMSGWFFDLEALRFVTSQNNPLTTVDNKPFFVSNGFTRYRLPQAGDQVTVYHDAISGGSKTSRIIGYELKLDKPYDTPTYTVGETAAFSRIKQLEKKITKLS